MLDDIGDAVDRSISGGPAAPASAPASFSMEPAILSNTQGYDFGRYLNAVITKVRQTWYAVMPEVARKGEVGRAVVGFDIVRDGKAENARLVQGTGNQVLDRGALAAIQLSSPFAALPVDFKGDRLVLRVTFQYNLRP
jgi:TonB family protein